MVCWGWDEGLGLRVQWDEVFETGRPCFPHGDRDRAGGPMDLRWSPPRPADGDTGLGTQGQPACGPEPAEGLADCSLPHSTAPSPFLGSSPGTHEFDLSSQG